MQIAALIAALIATMCMDGGDYHNIWLMLVLVMLLLEHLLVQSRLQSCAYMLLVLQTEFLSDSSLLRKPCSTNKLKLRLLNENVCM